MAAAATVRRKEEVEGAEGNARQGAQRTAEEGSELGHAHLGRTLGDHQMKGEEEGIQQMVGVGVDDHKLAEEADRTWGDPAEDHAHQATDVRRTKKAAVSTSREAGAGEGDTLRMEAAEKAARAHQTEATVREAAAAAEIPRKVDDREEAAAG